MGFRFKNKNTKPNGAYRKRALRVGRVFRRDIYTYTYMHNRKRENIPNTRPPAPDH